MAAARCRPDLLQLVYLGNGEVVRYSPDEHDLLATERKLKAVWTAIERAATTGDWRPKTPSSCATGATTGHLPRVGRHSPAAAGASLPPRPRPRETGRVEPADE